MRSTLLDRFESAKPPGLDALARDISDILGARRAFTRRMPGILNWGLPVSMSMSPSSPEDRDLMASHIEAALEEFEPRLGSVRALPVAGAQDFVFELKAMLVEPADQSVSVRILTPRRGGGLGAEVLVLGGTGAVSR